MVKRFLVLVLSLSILNSCFSYRTEFSRKRYKHRFLENSNSEDNCIDKTKIYKLISVENKPEKIKTKIEPSAIFLKFYEDGKVGKFYNFDVQDFESLDPIRADMGYYQCSEGKLTLAIYFDHPQGGRVSKTDYQLTKDSLLSLENDNFIKKYKPIFLSKDFQEYKPDW